MTRLTQMIFALGIVLGATGAFAQTYTGNLNLGSQAEVDAFAYTEVTGSLTISGVDIVDVSPLNMLVSVGSFLSISDNATLTMVDGFDNLANLGGGLFVWYNAALESFSGFGALVSTGDNIDFWFNDSLISVAGFESLQIAGWSLEFGGNPALTSIPDFESLQTVSSSLFILDNISLPSITGFNALQYVDWSFNIVGNSSLADLCGFYDYFLDNNPYTGNGDFSISDNHPTLPNPTTIDDILATGPCSTLPQFVRGDADGNGSFTGIVDALFILAFQFQNGPAPICMEAADVDGNGAFNGLVDALYTLAHQFQGAPPPPAPYPDCGADPDPDNSLGCEPNACP